MAGKILVADDDQHMRVLLHKRLTSVGYDVILVEDGGECIDAIRKEKPDLIILDVHMPIMDGGDVAAWLKENNDTKNIPVIFLTGLLSKDEEQNVSDGKHFMMAKPFDPEKLLLEIYKRIPRT